LNGGGGDAVAHSSERRSQGSPVSSRNSARRRMLTASWGGLKRDAAQDQGRAARGDDQPGCHAGTS
jgi:hypothetical protein